MSGRKSLPILENLEVIDIAADGRGIAKWEGYVIFIDKCIPGEILTVQVKKKKKSFMEAFPIKRITASPYYTTPYCVHHADCGGCSLQTLSYTSQLFFKEKMVRDNFDRIAKIPYQNFHPIIGCDATTRYRNKLEFSASHWRWLSSNEIQSGHQFDANETNGLGYHIPGRFDKVMHIDECHLMAEPSNAIRNFIYYHVKQSGKTFFDLREKTGFLRGVIQRNTVKGEYLIVFIFAENDQEAIQDLITACTNAFTMVQSVYYVVNTKLNDSLYDQDFIHVFGEKVLCQTIGHIQCEVGPLSFVQINNYQTTVLYNKIAELADLKGHEVVYDLFCGVGSIGLYLAKNCGHVIGIETVPEAIEYADLNKKRNQIDNATFICGTVEQILKEDFTSKFPSPDVVVCDPPRQGLHPNVVNSLKMLAPKRIVYVSCKASTQARDILMLAEMYDVIDVQPVDMFPNTPHVENIALLTLKKN